MGWRRDKVVQRPLMIIWYKAEILSQSSSMHDLLLFFLEHVTSSEICLHIWVLLICHLSSFLGEPMTAGSLGTYLPCAFARVDSTFTSIHPSLPSFLFNHTASNQTPHFKAYYNHFYLTTLHHHSSNLFWTPPEILISLHQSHLKCNILFRGKRKKGLNILLRQSKLSVIWSSRFFSNLAPSQFSHL
jgi:hypothetical protein